MTQFPELLAGLRRPRLLIRAARLGMQDYSRDRDLRRLISANRIPSPEQALSQLVEMEQKAEQTRQVGLSSYSFSHHINLLIALLSEARSLTRRTPA